MAELTKWIAARRAELEASNKDSIIDFMQWATAAHSTYDVMLDVIELAADTVSGMELGFTGELLNVFWDKLAALTETKP